MEALCARFAMQKVVGSSPIIRFEKGPDHRGFCVLAVLELGSRRPMEDDVRRSFSSRVGFDELRPKQTGLTERTGGLDDLNDDHQPAGRLDPCALHGRESVLLVARRRA